MLSNYYKPTPKIWRKIGDACMTISTVLSGGTLLSMDKLTEIFNKNQMVTFAVIVMVSGLVGKILTNFTTEGDAK